MYPVAIPIKHLTGFNKKFLTSRSIPQNYLNLPVEGKVIEGRPEWLQGSDFMTWLEIGRLNGNRDEKRRSNS